MSESKKYAEGQEPCLIAYAKCGCCVAACTMDVDEIEEISLPFIKEMLANGGRVDIVPVSFVRNGGLTFCECVRASEAEHV